MNDAINHYRTYLATADKQNATGLPHNVWAMLMTLDRMVGREAQQTESNWRSFLLLKKQVMDGKEETDKGDSS